MQTQRIPSIDTDDVARAAAEVRRLAVEGTPADDVRWMASVLCARFCGQIVAGELVLDQVKARRFGRLVTGGAA